MLIFMIAKAPQFFITCHLNICGYYEGYRISMSNFYLIGKQNF
ncbi:hypothetical protein SBF1_1640002 [Candidatus Desulfosporosinus infrequens]|uniref:Uncharacterized protein n=1 Tax=Candidatus Desulfosporosinus infrequens TaxID=2043169 RepID=A0A2U3KAN9_9FIRM|nr:hypothetical protein SBF1_1640002 [Candidatus Desulfosporosinus infrequens]